jgi:hypothetical protein
MTTTSAAITAGSDPLMTWAEQPLLMLRKQILAFLQGLFEASPVRCFNWNEDEESTDIIITDESPLNLEVVGKRPAISIVRGTVAWGQTSIDERLSEDMNTGARTHTDLLRGTLSVNCCSKVDLESEYLAWIVANHMWLLRRLIIKGSPVHEFGRGIQIGSPSPAGAIVQGDTNGEWINTPVSVSFFLQVSGSVEPIASADVIRNIEFKMGVRGPASIGPTEQVDPRWVGENPRPFPAGAEIGPPRIRGRRVRNIAFEQRLTLKKES